jgi:ribosomal-protein-alanine N-acetyltransferase
MSTSAVVEPHRRTGRHPGWPARLGPLSVRLGTVAVRPQRLRDGAAWSSIRRRDEHHLAPWEPGAAGEWALRNSTLEWVSRWSTLRASARRGMCLPFTITLDDVFVGQVMVGNVVREPLRSAYIGYWVSTKAVGAGIATAAVALVVDHSLGPVGLHRVEATVRPENVASRRVLEKLSFREEGLFRRYLEVGGIWRDHLCYALTAEEVPGGVVDALVRAGRVERV